MKSPSELLMKRETQISFGAVPRSLYGDALGETTWQMRDDQFLLRGEGDHYFHYRRGKGITIERGVNADLSEEELWLNGSVYSAIASINGLLPIHASAVACNEGVYAFTAPAAGGKSTLVAALADRGLPMFCDDTLVLDLSDPGRIMCLPGHKRLKLRADALELTGAKREEKVSQTVEKFYARPASGDVGRTLPLMRLLFLEEGPAPSIAAIAGAERFTRMQDDHQTAHLFASARRFDRAKQFAHLARLAKQIEMARFVRPLDPTRFDESVDLVTQYVVEAGL